MSESSRDSEAGREEQLRRRLQIATELLGLMYTLYVMWMLLVPEHRRRLLLMRLTATVKQAAGRAAFRTGHQAMGLELSVSVENYDLPYWLSRLRDRAAAVYDRLRYTI